VRRRPQTRLCATLGFAALALTRLSWTAQEEDPQALLAEADRLAWLYNWPKAGPLYAEAEKLFVQSGDANNALYAKFGRIRAQLDTGSLPALSEELANELESPVVSNDPELTLQCLVTKAAVDKDINEASARGVWEKILELAKSLSDRRWQARAQAELGIIAFLDGDVARSTNMLKSALISSYLQGDMGAAIMYGSIVGNGLVEVGQLESGLQYCDTALMQAAKTKDLGFPFMSYMGKARALIALHRESEAKKVLDEAIGQAKLFGARAEEAQLLIVRGKEASATSPGEAIKYLQEAKALCEAAGLRHALAWALLELARVYRDTDELDKAEESVAASLESMREVEDKYHLPLHFAVLAEVLAKKGQLNAAVQAYDQAADLVNAMLVNVPSPQVEGSLIAIEGEVFLGRFRLAVQLKDFNKAYQILESARGRSVADVLRTTPPKDVGLSSIAKAAQKEVNRIQIALLHTQTRPQRKRLLDRLFEAEQLLGPVAKPRNRLQEASLQIKPVDLGKLRKSLLPDEMILEYALDEPNSYCLTINREYSRIAVLPGGRKRIEQLVEHYLTEMKSKQAGLESGKELYSLLLGPVRAPAGKLRLVIVPDGKLHLLPFDSLRDHESHYVLTAHVVTYAPSATVLYLLRTSHSTHQATLRFLGVGDVPYQRTSALETAKTNGSVPTRSDASGDLFGSPGVKLKELPGSREEVIAAGEAVGNRSALLLGKKATETAFKSQPLADFQIIHLAVHGIASAKFPDRAALVLESDPASHEDGLLQVREIRNLPLNAELVTLTACDTGQGRLLGEDGIANLEQAFLLAGAKTVIASLWGADDTYTLALMKHFYRHLVDGQDKGWALRQAKIDLLGEFGERALPFYWAGFTMVGDGSRSVPIP